MFYCNSLRNEFQVTNNYKLKLNLTEKTMVCITNICSVGK
jgi:hypothetical protein